MFFNNGGKSVNFSSEEEYKQWEEQVNNFEKLIEVIKKEICKPIDERPMTLGEKNMLALFSPDKFDKELKSLMLKSIHS